MDVMFGSTSVMQDIRKRIELIAATDVAVLLQGESGTGKELCAQLIHALSPRAKYPYVKVSCPVIPNALIETELFGYERGAFNGALSEKRGRVEQAHKGTLVLDEVGSLDLTVQGKILQLLEDGTFTRVGGHETLGIFTHIISIANGDLSRQVAEGSFRLELLYRINAVTISLPSLRQRKVDLPRLVEYFAQKHANEFQVAPRTVSKDLLQLMLAYDWPGNIRQLDNLMRSYTVIGDESLVVQELAPTSTGRDKVSAEIDVTKPLSLKQITKSATKDLERQIILKVLQANSWNRQKTAKWLQISYRSLLYKLAEVGINHPETTEGHEESPLQEVVRPAPVEIRRLKPSLLETTIQLPVRA